MNHKKRSYPIYFDISIRSFLKICFFWTVENRGRYHPAVSNASYTLSPSAFGEILQRELTRDETVRVRLSTLLLWLSIHEEWEHGKGVHTRAKIRHVHWWGFFFSKITSNQNFGLFFKNYAPPEYIFFLIFLKYLHDFQYFTKNFTKIFLFSEFLLNFQIIFYSSLQMPLSKLQNIREWGLKKKTILENQTSMCPRV